MEHDMTRLSAILVEPPDGAVIDAIWRCKRGHEQAAAWHMPDGQRVTFAADWTFIDRDHRDNSICVRCVIDDYGMERIEFQEEHP